jgi:hypothetical protein
MPFGLCNTPETFQSYINNFLLEYLDIFYTAYLDNVLVYSNNKEDYTKHVLKMLHCLQDQGLHVDINKCEFDTQRVKYLGLIVTTKGIEMDPDKVAAIRDWQTPTSTKDV